MNKEPFQNLSITIENLKNVFYKQITEPIINLLEKRFIECSVCGGVGASCDFCSGAGVVSLITKEVLWFCLILSLILNFICLFIIYRG